MGLPPGDPWHSQGNPSVASWPDQPYQPMDQFGLAQVDPALRGHPNPNDRSSWGQSDGSDQTRYPQSGFPVGPPNPSFGNAGYSSYAHQPQQTPYYPPNYSQNVPSAPPQPTVPAAAPLTRHTYTRTLVGPLSSNGYRLLDEHRKPGIFFLFQDLSVRTEGTSTSSSPQRIQRLSRRNIPSSNASYEHRSVSSLPIKFIAVHSDDFVIQFSSTGGWCYRSSYRRFTSACSGVHRTFCRLLRQTFPGCSRFVS